MQSHQKPTALEFFAGGGLARLGLAAQFDTIWANDIDAVKGHAWIANFGPDGFRLDDINHVEPASLPAADLAWASFPCQDLSIAGGRAGIGAPRSGTFYRFVEIIKTLNGLDRAPEILVIENVAGLLTSHNGADFCALMRALADIGYQAGALEIDARYFLPQSRPRIFIVACPLGRVIPAHLHSPKSAASEFVTPAIVRAWHGLPDDLRQAYIWWALPTPPMPDQSLSQIVDIGDRSWWSQAKTNALIESLSPKHLEKLRQVQASGRAKIGAVYRRTRRVNGVSRPFAEVRFDGLAGCLRTPSGGSSRQFLMFVEGDRVQVRALNVREAMRLMGVSDRYLVPKSTLAGLKIAGDGVAVPVVAWLSQHLLGPLAAIASQHRLGGRPRCFEQE